MSAAGHDWPTGSLSGTIRGVGNKSGASRSSGVIGPEVRIAQERRLCGSGTGNISVACDPANRLAKRVLRLPPTTKKGALVGAFFMPTLWATSQNHTQ